LTRGQNPRESRGDKHRAAEQDDGVRETHHGIADCGLGLRYRTTGILIPS
jgi:hypothetical protein